MLCCCYLLNVNTKIVIAGINLELTCILVFTGNQNFMKASWEFSRSNWLSTTSFRRSFTTLRNLCMSTWGSLLNFCLVKTKIRKDSNEYHRLLPLCNRLVLWTYKNEKFFLISQNKKFWVVQQVFLLIWNFAWLLSFICAYQNSNHKKILRVQSCRMKKQPRLHIVKPFMNQSLWKCTWIFFKIFLRSNFLIFLKI